jgi:G3E family GTPase
LTTARRGTVSPAESISRRRRKPPIPLNVVTGHRGAGKTTLINRLLEDRAFANTAVILNDSGATAVKSDLVEQAEDGIIALGAGCVCCTVRGELVDALERLLRGLDNNRIKAIDRVVIEAEQSADPAAVLGAVLRHPYLSLRFAADGIVAVAAADQLDHRLFSDPAFVTQIASADLLVVSGQSEIPPQMVARLNRLNDLAPISRLAETAPSSTVGLGFWGADWEGGELLTRQVAEHIPPKTTPADKALAGEAGWITCFSVTRERDFGVDAVDRFTEFMAVIYGSNLIRVEGVAVSAGVINLIRGLGGLFLPNTLRDHASRRPMVALNVTVRDVAPADFIRTLDSFVNEARIDTPDRDALTDNPLAIAGFSARPGRN